MSFYLQARAIGAVAQAAADAEEQLEQAAVAATDAVSAVHQSIAGLGAGAFALEEVAQLVTTPDMGKEGTVIKSSGSKVTPDEAATLQERIRASMAETERLALAGNAEGVANSQRETEALRQQLARLGKGTGSAPGKQTYAGGGPAGTDATTSPQTIGLGSLRASAERIAGQVSIAARQAQATTRQNGAAQQSEANANSQTLSLLDNATREAINAISDEMYMTETGVVRGVELMEQLQVLLGRLTTVSLNVGSMRNGANTVRYLEGQIQAILDLVQRHSSSSASDSLSLQRLIGTTIGNWYRQNRRPGANVSSNSTFRSQQNQGRLP